MNNNVTNNRISCVIPVYNAEKTLRRCVDSILSGCGDTLELILIDDGSTDSSPVICDEYANADPRVRVVHKNNGGVASAKNEGIRCATGNYLTFVDSDDYVEPDYFDTLLAQLDDEDLVIAGLNYLQQSNLKTFETTRYETVGVHKKESFQECIYRLLNEDALNFHVAKLYRMQLIKENNILFTDFRKTGGDDTIFIFDMLCVSQKIRVIDNPIYNYILYGASTSHRNTGDRWKRGKVLDQYLRDRCIRLGIYDENMQAILDKRILSLTLWSAQEIASVSQPFGIKRREIMEILQDERYTQARKNKKSILHLDAQLNRLIAGKVTGFLYYEKMKQLNLKGSIYRLTPNCIKKAYKRIKGSS